MFADSHTVSLGFSSHLESSRNVEDKTIQTTVFPGIPKNCQSKRFQQIGIQTEDDEINDKIAYDERKFIIFLKNILPNVINELNKVKQSNVFLLNPVEPEENTIVQKVSTCYWDRSENIGVSGISWNCIGSVIAVGYSHALHSSWCNHIGMVAFYNVEIDMTTPICSIEVSSCVRAICMHPSLPSIVAAGTFSGDVLVWDINHEDSSNAFINSTGSNHLDSITQLRWVTGLTAAITLVSSALDGYLNFWKVFPEMSQFQLIERICCGKLRGDAGVTSFGLPKDKDDVIVAALEGGTLVLCFTTSAKPPFKVSVKNPDVLKNPVIRIYSLLPATAISIEFSPFHEDKFATVSTDQAIRIFSLLNNQVQCVIFGAESLIGVMWCLFQEDLLVAWGDKANLKLYSLRIGISPESYFLNDTVENNIQISAASFSNQSTSIVAIGSLEGTVYIWSVPSRVHVNFKSQIIEENV